MHCEGLVEVDFERRQQLVVLLHIQTPVREPGMGGESPSGQTVCIPVYVPDEVAKGFCEGHLSLACPDYRIVSSIRKQ